MNKYHVVEFLINFDNCYRVEVNIGLEQSMYMMNMFQEPPVGL